MSNYLLSQRNALTKPPQIHYFILLNAESSFKRFKHLNGVHTTKRSLKERSVWTDEKVLRVQRHNCAYMQK